MSMGTIGKLMKATRTQMIGDEADHISSEFVRRFGMRDGDYLRLQKRNGQQTRARIISVESVYWNNAGGYTADITVAPLLVNGKIGKTRSCMLSVNANGGGLKAVHFFSHVERVSEPRN